MLLDTPICDFGWKAPDFTLRDVDGVDYTVSNCLGDKGLLVAFICNHCPFVKAIGDRLSADAKLLMSEGINVLAVMSNDYRLVAEDSPENMKKFSQKHGFSFPYLIDEGQVVGKQYGAVCTPDFFGFNSRGELQYRGRLDNARMDKEANRVPELVNAMRMIAETESGPQDQSPSMGCSIKWSR